MKYIQFSMDKNRYLSSNFLWVLLYKRHRILLYWILKLCLSKSLDYLIFYLFFYLNIRDYNPFFITISISQKFKDITYKNLKVKYKYYIFGVINLF